MNACIIMDDFGLHIIEETMIYVFCYTSIHISECNSTDDLDYTFFKTIRFTITTTDRDGLHFLQDNEDSPFYYNR